MCFPGSDQCVNGVSPFGSRITEYIITFTVTVRGLENLEYSINTSATMGSLGKSRETNTSGLGKEKREMIVLCASCDFERGTRVSTPRSCRASTRGLQDPKNHEPVGIFYFSMSRAG